MTLRPSLLPLRLLLLLSGAVCRTEAGFETESPVRTLQVETLVEPPEPCAEPAAFGDTLHVHYTVRDLGGRVGAWEGAAPCWNTSALAATRGKRCGS